MLFIEIISTTGKNTIFGNIYRPPSGNFEMFENKLNEILSEVDKTKKITYLMGDFNIDLLKTDNCDYSNRFCEATFHLIFFSTY
jgi:exonuclease III